MGSSLVPASSNEELTDTARTGGPNSRTENSHRPTQLREMVMRRFKSVRHLQRLAAFHYQVANLFAHSRHHPDAKQNLALRIQAFKAWESVMNPAILERLGA